MTTVLGLDLSCRSTGVARTDGSTETIAPPEPKGRKRTLGDDLTRLSVIAGRVEQAIDDDVPGLVVIEDYAPGIRSAAAHRLAEVGGVVRLSCYRARVPLALVNVMHLKRYATGATRADKGEMRLAALKRAGVEFPNDDECDAWWLRAMGLDHLGAPIVDLPAANREVLERVLWPEL